MKMLQEPDEVKVSRPDLKTRQKSNPNLSLTIFYAACNGGNISSKENVIRHLTPFKDPIRVNKFAEDVLDSRVYQDLKNLGDFCFNGKVMVPTQEEPVIRLDDDNKPIPRRLSSPVYCSFEFLFITEIVKYVFEFYNFKDITVLQGMHDGIIFITLKKDLDTASLNRYLNKLTSIFILKFKYLTNYI